jgi:hypothetical protein
MEENVYYVARGRSLELLQDFKASSSAYVEVVQQKLRNLFPQFADENGFVAYWKDDEAFAGLVVEDKTVPLPPGLKRDKKEPTRVVFDKKTREGRAYEKVLNEGLPKVLSRWDLRNKLGLGFFQAFSVEEFEDGTWIVATSEDNPAGPVDAELIPRSVYWQKKEGAGT